MHIRSASPADAPFIARLVLEALHWDMFARSLTPQQERAWREVEAVCRLDNTLYSYRHAAIATIDGEEAGLLVAYDGAAYSTLRANTFSRLSAFQNTSIDAMTDETKAGEFYIDSLAVVPQFRGRGVGRALLRHALVQGAELQLSPTLLVAPDNASALRLYAQLGFVADGEIFAFGQTFARMTCRPAGTPSRSPVSFLDLCRQRVSVRAYAPDHLPNAADFAYIEECVRWAPSAVNRQPWQLLRITSPALLRALHSTYPREWFATAPAVYVLCKEDDTQWVRPADGHPHGDIDLAIATEHLCLAAAERGLGTCWVCNFDVAECRRRLNLSERLTPVALVPVGHPSPDFVAPPRKRKSADEIVEIR